MARPLEHILVVDVEATCWDGAPPPGQESEIIEIGVCVLDVASCERLRRETAIVRPERSQVSAFCTELTTLTAEEVAQGVSFAQACTRLKKEFGTRDQVWASFGDYDRKIFERQCQVTGVPYPFGPRHLNVKLLFALLSGLRGEVGMAEALRRLDLPLEGTHHRGGDDAWNIAAILARLLTAGRASLERLT